MKYTKYNIGPYNLHIINTNKFKTVTIDVEIRRKIVKEEITIRNLLSTILVASTKKYPTNRLLAIQCEKLYNLNVASSNTRVGNYMISSFTTSLLNEKYTENGLLKRSIDFFSDILFNPNIKDNSFDELSFKMTKNIVEKNIMSVKENMIKYGLIKLLEEMDDSSPISYNGYGYIEDLEKITKTNLVDYYKEMINKDTIDIFVVGEVDNNEVKKIITDKFKFNTIKKKKDDIYINHELTRSKLKEKKLEEEVTQSKLSIGCKLKGLNKFELNYVLKVYNQIFGGSADSKLFMNVREKESLAYYITSALKPYDNLLLIYSGINKENYTKTVKLVKKYIDIMKKGKITDNEIDNAKSSIISSMNCRYDNPLGIISDYYSMELSETDDIKTKINNINKVNKEDIISVAKKINIDTILLIHGGDKNEEADI